MSIRLPDSVVRPIGFKTVFRETKKERPLREKANRHAESTRERIPNKTQWALNDILNAAKEERAMMEEILAWIKGEKVDAKGRYDTARLARLGDLEGIIARRALRIGELERMAADARAGIYEQPTEVTPR